MTDSKTLAHLLKYDSLLGTLPGKVAAGENRLEVEGTPIRVFSERDPGAISWKSVEADIVIEATGHFTDKTEAEAHITRGGAKRVIISAPGKNEDITVVMGVNHDQYDPRRHAVVSNGSCTTNGLAPAALSIVPYSSGAAKAIGKVIPELHGRLTGYSLRVPVPVVSVVDLTATLKREVTVTEVNAAFRNAAESGPLQGILGYSDEPLVSSDYQGDPRSSIVDGLSTLAIGGKHVKILAWYDNEWGFSNRLIDLALLMEQRGL